MTENKNCLIVKYEATHGKWDETEERCFVLNEINSNKFHLHPINEIEISYSTAGGYDCEYVVAKLYFIETISRKTYDELKRLNMTDDEDEIVSILQ